MKSCRISVIVSLTSVAQSHVLRRLLILVCFCQLTYVSFHCAARPERHALRIGLLCSAAEKSQPGECRKAKTEELEKYTTATFLSVSVWTHIETLYVKSKDLDPYRYTSCHDHCAIPQVGHISALKSYVFL